MQEIAERYVKLVLAVGQHDAGYVDAYYGDPSWRPTGEPARLAAQADEARALQRLLEREIAGSDIVRRRIAFLDRQLNAVLTRVLMRGGTPFSFDEECRGLYDAEAPQKPEHEFAGIHRALDDLLPGDGPLAPRYEDYRGGFLVAPDRLADVFLTALDECRRRTHAWLSVPTGETFTVEYVTAQPWSAYNWYKGGLTSLIQVNTDLPTTIDRALDLACHEGYPGHHVYNALLEAHLVRDRGWVEFSVYPLFSPQSLIAEGTANLGIEIAFPGPDRLKFEQEVLYPRAGLDAATAPRFMAVQRLVNQLSYADNEAARRYLDGEFSRVEAAEFLTTWALRPPAQAEQRVRFIDRYRSYVINYNVGQDIARGWIERQGGTADNPARRWELFASLLTSPWTPSALL